MKFFKNKFFIAILAIIFCLFTIQSYFISNSYTRDTNSYVTLIQGDAILTTNIEKKILHLNEKEKISNGNVIHTLNNSLVVIEWGDKSITRLGSNSQIMVKENFVASDLSKINISFELLKGQTWSNVISVLSPDSQFTEEVRGVSAAVRGTVFEANYDNDYLVVHKHEVNATNAAGENIKIFPGETFSFKEFSFSQVAVKIDEAFSQLNEQMDMTYLKTLRDNFLSQMQKNNPINFFKNMFDSNGKVYSMLVSGESKKAIDDYITGLPQEQKNKIINTLITLNQSLNFENGDNKDLYNLKLATRGVLIDNSHDTAYNETLVKYSMYDLSDILSVRKFSDEIYKNTADFLGQNKTYLEMLKSNISGENGGLTQQLLNIKNFDFSAENVKTQFMNLDTQWKETLQNGAKNLFNGLTK